MDRGLYAVFIGILSRVLRFFFYSLLVCVIEIMVVMVVLDLIE